MSKLEDKAVELLGKLEDLSTEYAPEVIDAAAASVQVTAAQQLVYGVVWLIVGLICVWGVKKAYTNPDGFTEGGACVVIVVGCVVSFVSIIMVIFNLTDLWTYVALINPKLALAHKILGL